MGFLIPFLASLFNTAGNVFDKWLLSTRFSSYKTYLAFGYPLYVLCFLPFLVIFEPTLSPQVGSLKNLAFFGILVVLSLCENVLFYRALQKDLLTEMESIKSLESFSIVLLAGLILPAERNAVSLLLGLMAGGAIIFSHWQKNSLRFKKGTAAFLGWTVLGAPVQALVIRELLYAWEPMTLNFMRIACEVLVMNPWVLGTTKDFPKKTLLPIIAVNFFYAFYVILQYLSYQKSGIIYTTIIFSLTPFFVYLTSVFFLKERPNWKKNLAFAVILFASIVVHLKSK